MAAVHLHDILVMSGIPIEVQNTETRLNRSPNPGMFVVAGCSIQKAFV